ncbi:hypothetical protein J5J83_07830 [Azoarcus sp. L1K30]|uniref:hypothetical protein n=1 Tax=Azoarcus sp. L1K30 TaxID=2820277 RepID=UPI001B8409B0|nr:hypothetical protein [Azoarcus sp. L1K30]MBR0566021.1 hypothetical protein [Azoarcus sp. L1K30]
MRLSDLRDIYSGQEIYIVGSGPTANVFPMDFLADKICMSLNDSFKINSNITPIAFMHHQTYCREGNTVDAPLHPNFSGIKYPVVKGTGRNRKAAVDWDNPYFYFFDWSHDIDQIYEMSKNGDYLYYTPEGCSLHGALQLAWIMGARTIYTIGCDSTTLGGKHYAQYDKNKFREDEVLKRGQVRNYDSYVKGTLVVQDFLRRKGVRVLNLSPVIGYHLVDYQYEVLKGDIGPDEIVAEFTKLSVESEAP